MISIWELAALGAIFIGSSLAILGLGDLVVKLVRRGPSAVDDIVRTRKLAARGYVRRRRGSQEVLDLTAVHRATQRKDAKGVVLEAERAVRYGSSNATDRMTG